MSLFLQFDNSTLLGFQEKGKTAFLNMKNVQNLVDFFLNQVNPQIQQKFKQLDFKTWTRPSPLNDTVKNKADKQNMNFLPDLRRETFLNKSMTEKTSNCFFHSSTGISSKHEGTFGTVSSFVFYLQLSTTFTFCLCDCTRRSHICTKSTAILRK